MIWRMVADEPEGVGRGAGPGGRGRSPSSVGQAGDLERVAGDHLEVEAISGRAARKVRTTRGRSRIPVPSGTSESRNPSRYSSTPMSLKWVVNARGRGPRPPPSGLPAARCCCPCRGRRRRGRCRAASAGRAARRPASPCGSRRPAGCRAARPRGAARVRECEADRRTAGRRPRWRTSRTAGPRASRVRTTSRAGPLRRADLGLESLEVGVVARQRDDPLQVHRGGLGSLSERVGVAVIAGPDPDLDTADAERSGMVEESAGSANRSPAVRPRSAAVRTAKEWITSPQELDLAAGLERTRGQGRQRPDTQAASIGTSSRSHGSCPSSRAFFSASQGAR